MAQTEGLRIEAERKTSTRTQVTARLNGRVIEMDVFNLGSAKARDAFLDTLCEGRAGIDRDDARSKLLELADERPTPGAGERGESAGELDVSCVVRPERIITPDISALSVPTLVNAGGEPCGRWRLYVAWSDGRRERRDLTARLDLAEGGALWVHPLPGAPRLPVRPRWSAPARQAWLDGASTPSPARVFMDLTRRLARYIELPDDRASGTLGALALWAMLTYCYPAWDALPYLHVGGPLGSGKTRVLELLHQVVFRPMRSSNTTGPALFRTLHQQGGTVLFDEAEQLRQSTPESCELLSMLLAGYKRGGQATRLEAVGDTFQTAVFDVYGPKALACIAGVPPALASRCIPVMMLRAGPGSAKPRRRIAADSARWQALRDALHALALDCGPTFMELAERPDVCPEMSGRHRELWQPLLGLASWVEADGARGLLALMQQTARWLIEAGQDDETSMHDEVLLEVLTEMVRADRSPTPGEILAGAQDREPDMFRRWWARTVTSHLKAYGLPAPRKTNGRRQFRDVTMDMLLRVQRNYGIDLDIRDPGPEAAAPDLTGVPAVDAVPDARAEGLGQGR